ncbi:hypothetical protein [Burkholderia gladioli]|uniref:hypothetical protein n=1 Tax=Burkholderia gladioli TaxID=28095 RepID=UPI0034DABC7E
MTATQTRNRLVQYLANGGEKREPLRALLKDIADGLSDSVIFGGMIRDFGLGYARFFRSDIDIVTMSTSAEIYSLIKQFDPIRNKFGGFRFSESGRLFDIWSFYDTWAIREGYVDGKALDDLCKTTFFSLDAAIFRLQQQSLTATQDYENILMERVLGINLVAHPFPDKIALRAIQMAVSKDLFVAPNLCEFIIRNLRDSQLDAGCRSFVDSAKCHLRHFPERNFKYGVQLSIWPEISNSSKGCPDTKAKQSKRIAACTHNRLTAIEEV